MSMHCWHGIGAGLAALLLGACATSDVPTATVLAAGLQAPEGGSGYTDKPGWVTQRDMVVAAHPLAARAGQRILRAGGSAVDAVIAAQMVLTLVEPQSSGLGGGLFLVHHDGRRVTTIDGRETAPAAATPALFVTGPKPLAFMDAVVGGRSVGAPGVLRALELAHRLQGRLAWKDLFEPAIELAEQGFPVGARLAAALRSEMAQPLRRNPAAMRYFFDAAGQPWPTGTVLRNPALATTLRAVSLQGAVALYEGPLARDIVDAVRGHAGNPGLLSLSDLAGYRAVERSPLCFDYRAWLVCGMGPPSSGALAVGQLLGMLAQRPLASLRPIARDGFLEPHPDAVHLFSEAGRLAYADRARYVADPDFVPLPGGSAAALLDPAYLRARGALIGARSMGVAASGEPVPAPAPAASDSSLELAATSHISAADGYGNVVSVTSSIENGFGAQLMVGGFLLNNQLTDFSFVPAVGGVPVANRVEGGKRPRSSMAPMLVFEKATVRASPASASAVAGQPGPGDVLLLSLGSPGGSSIINYVAKALVATLDWQLDLQQAFAMPNAGSRNGPTELEQGRVSAALLESLVARGHAVQVLPQTSGLHGLQRLRRPDGMVWFGAADPRREGIAAGN